MARPMSVKRVIAGIVRKKAEGPGRVVLGGRASVTVRELSRRTGIGVEELGNSAIDALAAALRDGVDEVGLRDRRIRDWLVTREKVGRR